MNYTSALDVNRDSQSRIVAVVEVIAVAGLIAVCAQIKFFLPWTPAPITLQTLPVLAMPFVVGRDRCAWGILLYLMLGLIQAPVFAVPFGPTFGYLAAFVATPYITTRVKSPMIGIAAAMAFIYVIGASWLSLWTGAGLWSALWMGVIPFIPGDVAKAAIAYGVARWMLARSSAVVPDAN